MLIMQHPVFRRFWYPTLALADLADGPKPFKLLSENIVLWRQANGAPAALEDRCPHRRARLSVDSYVIDGALQCGYHGWRFNAGGRCVLVPQMPDAQPGAKSQVKSYQCKERYGFVWVCLSEEPLLDIPYIRHSDDPAFRQVFEYDEDWKANAFVVCENALDIGHISFVHRKTFGNDQKPASPRLQIVPLDHGVNFNAYKTLMDTSETRRIGIGDVDDARMAASAVTIKDAFDLPKVPTADAVFSRAFLPPKAERMPVVLAN